MENKDFEMLFCLHGYVERDCPKCTSKPPMENKVQVSQEFVDVANELKKQLRGLVDYHWPDDAVYSEETFKIKVKFEDLLARAEQAFASHKDGSLGEGGNGGE